MSAGVCRAASIALTGLEGTRVLVEAAVSQQLPGMAIIGLPDTALAEAKLRVRTATTQSGLPLSDRFLTCNLSPASLPKQGTGFDLAIALAALAASARMPDDRLSNTAHLGELGLDGELRRPAGLLAAVVAARNLGFERIMVPECCQAEASLVPEIEIIAAESLSGAVAWHRNENGAWHIAEHQDRERAPSHSRREPDMSDIVGQDEAVEALVIAAAGRHHVSLLGPPGAGKTLLASRLPSILPDLTPDEAISASSIAGLNGAPVAELTRRPPFESPHHTASQVSIIGGGDIRGVRPGAVTQACYGVLFLDEAPEFASGVLDALRQPLESGVVNIHRAKVRATLPAKVQLVLAANPCPCGNSGSADTAVNCRCSPGTRIKYLRRISGPLSDRIDVRLTVRRVSSVLLQEGIHQPTITSQQLRERVYAARERAAYRLRDTPWSVNADLPGEWLRGSAVRLPRSDTVILDRALALGALTVRGYDRTLRIAWTIADLGAKERPGRNEVAQALTLRGDELS